MKNRVVILSLLFSVVLQAQPLCFNEMNGDVKSFHHLEVYQNGRYQVMKLSPAPNGGQHVLLKLKEASQNWMIGQRTYFDNAPAGNPLWFFSILPRELTDFFGFKLFDEKMQPYTSYSGPRPTFIQIPDVFEINRTLEKLDLLLRSKGVDGVPYRFQVDNGKTPVANFLENLLSHNIVPFSTDPYISYHDMNYHFMTFFLITKEMHLQSQRVTEVFMKFANWLKATYPHEAKPEVLNDILSIRANEIDRLGNVTVVLQDPYEASYVHSGVQGLSDFLGKGDSPFEFFKASVKARMYHSPILDDLSFKYFDEFRKTLEPQMLVPVKAIQDQLKVENEAIHDLTKRLKEIQRVLRANNN